MTAAQKRILSILFVIFLLLVGFFAVYILWTRQNDRIMQEKKAEGVGRPLTNEELSIVAQRLMPKNLPTGTPQPLSPAEQKVIKALTPEDINTPEPVQGSRYRYDAPPPPSKETQDLLKMLSPK